MSEAQDIELIRGNGALLQSIVQRHVRLTKSAGNMVGLCPFHNESTPSFTVYQDGHFHCFGCNEHGTLFDWYMRRENLDFPAAKARAMVDAGFTRPEASPGTNGSSHPPGAATDILREYDYLDQAGRLVVQVVRTKSGRPRFRQRCPNGNNGWAWHGIDNPPLYLEPELRAAPPDATIWICEGEKDTDRLHHAGFIATTNIGGSTNWQETYTELFTGRHVVVLEDHDKAGHDRSRKILGCLKGTVASIKVLRLPDLLDKEDVSDWLDAGNTFEALRQLGEAPEETLPPPPIPFTTFQDVQNVIELEDFVEDLLVMGSMSIVYGQSNCGKSFFVLDLAMRVAAGQPWRNQDVDRGAVLYLALEGGNQAIRNRLLAISQHEGWNNYPLPFAFVSVPIDLRNPDAHVAPLIETVQILAKRFAAAECPVRWIIVDTLARAMNGGNENASDDMGALVINCDTLRSATRCHLTLVHHSGKDEARGARGHSSLVAATDTEIEIIDRDGTRTVTVTKQRDLPTLEPFAFQLKTVEIGTNRRGKPITTCLVQYEGEPTNRASRRSDGSSHAARAFEILTDLCATQGMVGAAGVPGGFGSVPADWWRDRWNDRAMPGDKMDTKGKAFRRASGVLIGSGKVGMAGNRVWVTHSQEDQ